MANKTFGFLLVTLCLALAVVFPVPVRAAENEEPAETVIIVVTQEPMPVNPPTLVEIPEEEIPLAETPTVVTIVTQEPNHQYDLQ